MSSANPSVGDVGEFIREFGGFPRHRHIDGQTRLEADLGITGDDGDELLCDAARHFNASLADPVSGYRETFSLGPNAYLFHGEGFDLIGIGAVVRWVTGRPRASVRDLTVGELHDAISRTIRPSRHDPSLEHSRDP